MNNKAVINAYPDSIGNKLEDIVDLLKQEEMKDAFGSFYILPSVFNTDLDRGFSLISYDLNETMAKSEDIEDIKNLKIDLIMDFILNHISVLSPEFQDLLEKGTESEYKDFFIDWNEFWKGHGTINEDGVLVPDEDVIKDMFFRKEGLPILKVRFPDGSEHPYWNTFYQKVIYYPVNESELVKNLKMQYDVAKQICALINPQIEKGTDLKNIDYGQYDKYKEAVNDYVSAKRSYLGQMDLNIRSEKVWEYYQNTLKKLSDYGVSIVRLDAFAYAPKTVGKRNFLNNPDTFDLLEKINNIATPLNLTLLPEIHASYYEATYKYLADKGYMVYDFFLPGLIIDAFERRNGTYLKKWADEITESKIKTLNMLGCHDGIPLLDLKGLLPEEDIQRLIDVVVGRGGYVKDLHGATNVYYQVNATYFSALGEDEKKMLLARAIQLFMPGKPQIYYLDLFAGKNDYEAMKRAGVGGHKEINRSNIALEDAKAMLKQDIVKKQIELLRFRNNCPAFNDDAKFDFVCEGNTIKMTWTYEDKKATLNANLDDYTYSIDCENC